MNIIFTVRFLFISALLFLRMRSVGEMINIREKGNIRYNIILYFD